MKSIDATALTSSSDPSDWLNKQIAADAVTIEGLESYLSSLQLSLTMLAQECADSDDILAGQYLSQMPSLAVDIDQMLSESTTAVARLKSLSDAGAANTEDKTSPFKEIERLTIAMEKVNVATKILSRGRRQK